MNDDNGDLEAGLGRYHVVFERDVDGRWTAFVAECPPCHTHGRSLAQARERIREALGLFYQDAETAELVDDIRIPSDLYPFIAEWRTAKAAVEAAQTRASQRSQALAEQLQRLQLSTRDAATLLGLSQQRVAQLNLRRDKGGRTPKRVGRSH